VAWVTLFQANIYPWLIALFLDLLFSILFSAVQSSPDFSRIALDQRHDFLPDQRRATVAASRARIDALFFAQVDR
jgi:hypothetical protein